MAFASWAISRSLCSAPFNAHALISESAIHPPVLELTPWSLLVSHLRSLCLRRPGCRRPVRRHDWVRPRQLGQPRSYAKDQFVPVRIGKPNASKAVDDIRTGTDATA